MEQRNIKILTFLGYLWILIASLWTIFEIANASFGVSGFLEVRNLSYLIGVIIFVVSILFAIIFYKWYPSILDLLFIGKSDEERYINLSSEDKLNHSTLLNNFNLNYLHNELNLLEPIKDLIESEQYKRAVDYGVWASGTFLRMNNHTVRVINGLYTLFALERLRNVTESKDFKPLDYISHRIKVDDLGWSLYSLNAHQVQQLKSYLNKFPHLDPTNQYSSFKDNRLCATEQLKNTIITLENDEKRFYSVACQAIRHILGFDLSYVNEEQKNAYGAKYKRLIKKIKNRRDKKTALAHEEYLNIKNTLSLGFPDKDTFDSTKKSAEKVTTLYDSVGDTMRKVKMYQVLGSIYEAYADFLSNDVGQRDNFLRKAYDEYKKGIRECDELVRFDELLSNCLSAANCAAALGIENEQFIIKGLKIARFVKNRSMILQFEALRRPINIVLLRHGESKKNLEKIINGSGALTAPGKEMVNVRADQIVKHLDTHQIGHDYVTIYGQDNKEQVQQSIDILSSKLPNATVAKADPRIAHKHLGSLSGKSEKDVIGNPEYLALERWRNKDISINELKINGMESPKEFWERAERFINEIKQKNEFSIIVCTTSVAILLTHILLGNTHDSDKHRCINVPLCGLIHFKGNELGEVELSNRDTLTNVSFSEFEGVV